MNSKKTAQPQTGAGSLIGYARVSTDDQDCAAQVWELRKAGCTEIVQEYGSGADKHRPALTKLLGSITAGDTLVIVIPPLPSSSLHTDAHDIWNAPIKSSPYGFYGLRNNVPQLVKPSPKKLQLQAALAGPANVFDALCIV